MSVEPEIAKPEDEPIEISIVDWGNSIGQSNQHFVEVEVEVKETSNNKS